MIRWIDSTLGTAAFEDPATAGHQVLDVRSLVDGPANGAEALRERIQTGLAMLRATGQLVVCCDYGISRSNTIAAAILACRDQQPFDGALATVQKQTGEWRMDYGIVQTVRAALEPTPPLQRVTGRVLVTGGTGFLGSWLERVASGSCELIRLGGSDIDLTKSPYDLDAAVRKHQPDAIIHLANPRVYHTHEVVKDSLAMLRNVTDVCHQHGLFLVYPSSWVVFSGRKGDEDMVMGDEEEPLPYGNYAMSKALSENMLKYLRLTGRIRASVLRLTPVFGEGSWLPRFLFRTAEQCRAGKQVTTHLYRNGRPKLQLLHARDAAVALLLAAERKLEGTFNIGGAVAATTQEIARMIAGVLGLDINVQEVSLEANVANVILDTGKAAQQLGWEAKSDLRESLSRLLGQP